MDDVRFDAISRVLAGRIGRRRLVAAALGLAATGAGLDAASAADPRRSYCRALRTTCNRNNQCCSGYCDTRVLRHRTRINKCACPVDTTECRGRCVDTAHDFDHCGGCGQACDPIISDTCWHDHCHCGEDPACADGETCENGTCVKPIVEPMIGDCDTDLSPDVPYCVRTESGDDWLALCTAGESPVGSSDWQDFLCTSDTQCASSYPNCGADNVRCDCMVGVQVYNGAFYDISAIVYNLYQGPPNSGLCVAYTTNPDLCVAQ